MAEHDDVIDECDVRLEDACLKILALLSLWHRPAPHCRSAQDDRRTERIAAWGSALPSVRRPWRT